MCGHHFLHSISHAQPEQIHAQVRRAEPQVATRPCPSCGTAVQDDFVFCPRCGAEVLTACPSCHRAVQTDWTHCAYCGVDLLAEKAKAEEPHSHAK
jgi:RNA polymerase subunit RPABC4/transcription elongation factor Spt4